MAFLAQRGAERLHYRQQGEGLPAIVLLHGAGGSSAHFAEQLRLLGRHRRVVAVDLPGHGRSDPIDEGPAELLEAYAEAVASSAEQLGLGRYVVAGHSMGGAVAQLLALRYAERVAALVLIASASRFFVSESFVAALDERFDDLASLFEAWWYSPASSATRVERWASQQLQCGRRQLLDDFRACGCFDLRGRLAELEAPVTVISGADDRLTPPATQRRLAAELRRPRWETLFRAGHALFLERPRATARLILAGG